MKIGFVFPGQGAQYVGMGQELAGEYPVAKQIFNAADEILGFSLSQICFAGPTEKLQQNDIVQPAIMVTSLAIRAILEQEGIQPKVVAGLSVGEYTALVAAKALDFSTALTLVRTRGKIMRTALPPGEGGMLALIGLSRASVQALCEEITPVGCIEPCNYNCPGQIVVGGTLPAIIAMEKRALKEGARKAVRVAMSSPSHCSLLDAAAQTFRPHLDAVSWQDAQIPVIANVDAQPAQAASALQQNLTRQLCEAVMWEDVILQFEKMGVTHMVEVGPGHVLSGFARKTTRRLKAANVEDLTSLREVMQWLKKTKGDEMAC